MPMEGYNWCITFTIIARILTSAQNSKPFSSVTLITGYNYL